MWNLGPEKILVVLVVALVVLGPDKLPQAARNVGKAYQELRRIAGGLRAEVEEVFAEPLREVRSAIDEPSRPAPLTPGVDPDDPIWRQRSVPTEDGGGPGVAQAPREGPASVPFLPGDPSLN